MSETNKKSKILKRVEVLGEALQTALEAILEIQSEQKLISYLLTEEDRVEAEKN